MMEIEMGAMPFKIVDATASAMDGVTFAGPCVATATVVAGPDTMPNGWRKTSILTASIGGQAAAMCGCIDFKEDVGHLSAGPASLTLAVPSGYHGQLVVTGGKPKSLLVALTKLQA